MHRSNLLTRSYTYGYDQEVVSRKTKGEDGCPEADEPESCWKPEVETQEQFAVSHRDEEEKYGFGAPLHWHERQEQERRPVGGDQASFDSQEEHRCTHEETARLTRRACQAGGDGSGGAGDGRRTGGRGRGQVAG